MNAPGPVAASLIAQARVDREGRLLVADPAIDALNSRAGGAMGVVMAVPQLATVARLARRLDIPVSRSVIVADEDVDLELWVRAEVDGEEVRLAISGWREVPGWRPAPTIGQDHVDADWRWEADADLRLTFLSLESATAAGLDPFALLGQPLTAAFLLEGKGAGAALPILDALARQQPFDDQPARVRASARPVMLSASIRRDGAGAFAGLSGGVRMVEAAQAETQEGLPASFTGGLDRALRAPLTRIVANADSMSAQADGPIAPTYADYANDIAGAGRHLLALIDDLVDLQAVERPDFVLALETIDLADVARRAAGLLGVRAADGQVTVDRPAADVTVAATGDFRRALQIATNLIGNAIRYSPPGAVVTVSAMHVGAAASLIVSDTGKGIKLGDQARIFEKFGRVDPSEEGGNGLGLYIARRLARAMGGDLIVESAPGAGARFTLTLAAAPDRRA